MAETYIEDVGFANSAPIAMLKTQNSVNIIDLYSGQALSKQNITNGTMGQLSPNGRLYTAGNGTGTRIYDAETGDQMGEFPSVNVQNFFWLDNRIALYYERGNQNVSTASMLDFTTGTTTSFDGINSEIIQIFPDTVKQGEYIVVLKQSALRIAVSNEANAKIIVKQVIPLSRSGWDRRAGTTSDGKSIFRSSQELEFISIADLQISKLDLKPFQLQTVAATADPNVLIITGRASATGGSRYLLALSQKTIAPIQESTIAPGRLVYIPSIKKNAIVSESRLVLLDKIDSNAPQSVYQFVGEMTLAQSEYKLKMFEQQQNALRQMQNSGSLSQLGHPSAYSSQTFAQSKPEWADADSIKDASIQAVGIYQGKTVGGSKNRPYIQIRVRPSSKPIVLVLSSYSAVRWIVTPERGARISTVLVSGYESSDVIGAGQARILRLGSDYAYERSSPQYQKLDDKVYRFLGRRIGTFQGLYEGENFSVGGSY